MSVQLVGSFDALGAAIEVWASAPLVAELERVIAGLALQPPRDLAPKTAIVAHQRRYGRWWPRRGRVDAHIHRGDWEVWSGDVLRGRGVDADSALYEVLVCINEVSAAAAAEHDLVLHGGAVEIDGRAVVVTGHSHAGKSTLTAHLVRSGAGFLAEENCVIDSDLRLRAFHRPIGLRPGGAATIGEAVPDGPYGLIYPLVPDAGFRLVDHATLALIAILHRVEDDAPDTGPLPRLEPVAPAQALFDLANQSLGTEDRERLTFRRLEATVRRVPVVELHYRHPRDAAALLREWIADQP